MAWKQRKSSKRRIRLLRIKNISEKALFPEKLRGILRWFCDKCWGIPFIIIEEIAVIEKKLPEKIFLLETFCEKREIGLIRRLSH